MSVRYGLKSGFLFLSLVFEFLLPGSGLQTIFAAGQARASLARIELLPVVTAGLTQPIYVTNAHDGSNRLFIIEQPGRIRVLRPAASSPAVFLDITPRVLSGGERGLLGLAFHPQFAANGRLFVNYTRRPDGATVIAEYRVSSRDPDVADPDESVLVTIAQPYANHNGGMVEFGPDGFLYIGAGDGGSGNDPGNRAQDPQDLLGKILRIDVDRISSGRLYSSPPDNPYYGTAAGREEIYALGLRNPWRFSFDRTSGLLYAGDVGQNLIEEINIVRLGGNYGWRIFEGTRCTNLGPASCSAGHFTAPIAEYGHDSGRCSVTGGYVYRGKQASLPFGAYVYGDYCSGEIFLLSGGTQSLLLKSGVQIASFGEDEEGEIYVVGIAGTVHRLANPDAPAKPVFHLPMLVSRSGTDNEYTGFAATNHGGATADLTFTAYERDGSMSGGNGVSNPRSLALLGGEQLARLETQIFGEGLSVENPPGWVKVESSVREMSAFFLAGNSGLTVLDGGVAISTTPGAIVFTDTEARGSTQIHVVNPYPETAQVAVRLFSADGTVLASANRTVKGNGILVESAEDLFPGRLKNPSDYIHVSSGQGIVAFEYLFEAGIYARGLNGQDATAGAATLYAPQYVVGGGYRSALSIVNLDSIPGRLTLRFFRDDGTLAGNAREVSIAGHGKVYIDDLEFFGDFGNELAQGYVEISSTSLRLAGSVTFSDPDQRAFSAALPLVSTLENDLILGHVASDSIYFTGIASVSPGNADTDATIEVFARNGDLLDAGKFHIKAGGRTSGILTEYFPALSGLDIRSGYIRITSGRGLAAFALFGTHNLSALSAIPAQRR